MELFVEFSLIITLATVMGGIMRVLKQPLIMGHIITGIIVGPHFLNLYKNAESAEIFSIMGISILLFIVGLSLSPKVIREVGKVAVITGIGQILVTVFFGFLLARFFGYNQVSSLYIAIALTFSSTIIILKLLSDKKDLEKLYGRIAIGFLLVQDIVATLILIGISSLGSGEGLLSTSLLLIIKGLVITIILSLVSFYVLPSLSTFFARSQEYLFLFSIGWGFGLALAFTKLGFSPEIGALVAGVALSMSPFAEEMSSKLKPLRDFFIITFFILLGVHMDLTNLGPLIIQAVLLSLFVLIGNPIIVIFLMELLGYSKKTSFSAGLTVAQISEFSLIIVLMGLSLGHVSRDVLSLVTLVGLITISGSTYMILYSDKLFQIISPYLSFFKTSSVKKETVVDDSYSVILFGCHRVGFDFIEAFKKLHAKFLAVDFDPEIVSDLDNNGINVKYGDAEDAEFLEEINVHKAHAVISTIPDFDTNLFLLIKVRTKNPDSIIILTSVNIDDALTFYEKGADYVIVPHFIGGQFVSRLAKDAVFGLYDLQETKSHHVSYLRNRKQLGHVASA